VRSPASLLLRRRTIIAATLSLVIFTATISVLMGISSLPKTMLGNADVYVITSKGSESVLTSRIDVQLAEMLLENRFVTNASPEIFAFAEYRGEPVTIRGVEFGQFMSVERGPGIRAATAGPIRGADRHAARETVERRDRGQHPAGRLIFPRCGRGASGGHAGNDLRGRGRANSLAQLIEGSREDAFESGIHCESHW